MALTKIERERRASLTPPGYKFCGSCDKAYPATEEFFRISKSGRVNAKCKSCYSKYHTEYRKRPESKEKSLKRQVKFYNKPGNREKILKKRREHNASPAKYSTFFKKLKGTIVAKDGSKGIRRDPSDNTLIQVRCHHCDAWMNPTVTECTHKSYAVNNVNATGKSDIYCSAKCKAECTAFGQIKYMRGEQPTSRREEASPIAKELCLSRDNHTCQICGTTEGSLEVHHIVGTSKCNLFSNDIDNLETLCTNCHNEWHREFREDYLS